jgi:hypothetical protein
MKSQPKPDHDNGVLKPQDHSLPELVKVAEDDDLLPEFLSGKKLS